MKEKVIAIMRDKGIQNPDRVVEELVSSGVMTHYDLCKYVGREEFFRLAMRYPSRTERWILERISVELSLSESTLRRAL